MKDDIRLALTKMLRVNLLAKSGERVLVFADRIAAGEDVDALTRSRREGLLELAKATAEAGREVGLEMLHTEFDARVSHGSEPGEELWRLAFGDACFDALLSAGILGRIREKKPNTEDIAAARDIVLANKAGAVDAVVALSNYSTSHTRFRDLLTTQADVRYASMPLFETDMLFGSMDADWGAIKRKTLAACERLDGAVSARITTPEGTDITLGLSGRKANPDTGVLDAPGAFSNLPAGEAYVAPLEGTANGTLVIIWGPAGKLGSPITVDVADGRAGEVLGDDPYTDRLIEQLDRFPDNRNIAELGIGTNDKATRPDNILESEKIAGTIHIAFGDNSSMGGVISTPYHQDFVYFGPTVMLMYDDGSEYALLRDGELLV
jgi:leucyl aminopeptidase (aminopeptidase T)